jgi:hypothetical protein
MNAMAGSILRQLGIALERDEHNTATVHVCAWCDEDKTQTAALLAAGRRVSHTCCPDHSRQMMDRARELNKKGEA